MLSRFRRWAPSFILGTHDGDLGHDHAAPVEVRTPEAPEPEPPPLVAVADPDRPPAAEWCTGRTYHRFQAVPGTDKQRCLVCGGFADPGIVRVEAPLSKRQVMREHLLGKH